MDWVGLTVGQSSFDNCDLNSQYVSTFEPTASRLQSERSTTDLSAHSISSNSILLSFVYLLETVRFKALH